MNKMDYLGRYSKNRGKSGKQTNREKKKKILAERRKALNIDHLSQGKLAEKARELHAWLAQLEAEKYDFERRFKGSKHEIRLLRQRVQEFQRAHGGGPKTKPKTKIIAGDVTARGGLFEEHG